MPFEIEQEQRRRSFDGREVNAERKESGEDNVELKRAAAMERADLIVKEVKTSQKQMQNILTHIQTVLSAIRQLRQQLRLAQTSDDPASVKQDKKQIEVLKKKIKNYGDELEKMRGDLIREQIVELSRRERDPAVAGANGVGIGMTAENLRGRAEEMVEKMIREVKKG